MDNFTAPLVGLTGRSGAGQEQVADLLASTYGFRAYELSGPMRDFLLSLDPLVGDRSLRQLVEASGWDGALADRLHGGEVARLERAARLRGGVDHQSATSRWLEVVAAQVGAETELTGPAPVVIPDIRFDHEAKWVTGHGGMVWRVTDGHEGGLGRDEVSDEHVCATVRGDGATQVSLGRRVERALAASDMNVEVDRASR